MRFLVSSILTFILSVIPITPTLAQSAVSQHVSKSGAQYKLLRHNNLFFEIEIPADWSHKETVRGFGQVLVLHPSTTDPDKLTKGYKTVSLSLARFPGSTLEETRQMTVRGMTSMYKDVTLVKEKDDSTINGNPAVSISYTRPMPSGDRFYEKITFIKAGSLTYRVSIHSVGLPTNNARRNNQKIISTFRPIPRK